MKYIEYMQENPTEGFNWCHCYTNAAETHYLVMYDGTANSISTPNSTAYRYGGCDFDSELETLAREVNPNYDSYTGYNDSKIAIDAMHVVGCWHCPFRDECETMGEEMDDTDYR